MTSVLNVDTIADKAGTGPVGLTKQNAAKVYVAATTSATITDSFNVSSSTDEGTGDYKYGLTNAIAITSWQSAAAGTVSGVSGIFRLKSAEASTTVLDIECMDSSFSAKDCSHSGTINGDLA